MLDDVYRDFDDPEGNFLEQFQTTGFDARFFELYLYAYFSRSGFQVNRSRANPDFLVTLEGETVAVEATTVNPSLSGALAEHGRKLADLSEADMPAYQMHELPIRFGGPLFSKLGKRYWELEHCRDLPFVIAIEAFFEQGALGISSEGVSRFVYGLEQTGHRSTDGSLRVDTSAITEHVIGGKRVPSNFFGQPGTEHVSSVLFTNSGTSAKFSRMGYQTGYGCEKVDISRRGFCFNPDPSAMHPTLFSYNMDAAPLVESWGQGLVLLHNPNALHPVSKTFFVDAMQGYIEDGVLKSDHPSWDPISSRTNIVYLRDLKKRLPKALRQARRIAVSAISKADFQAIWGFSLSPSNPYTEEHGWFTDETVSFLGVVFLDKTDRDWGFAILARDERFQFRAIEVLINVTSSHEATVRLMVRIADRLEEPQRIFPQGTPMTQTEAH